MKYSVLCCLILCTLCFGCGSNQEEKGPEALLSIMRNELGLPDSPDALGIYALADCSGPGSEFTTLVMSSATHTRFEQKSGPRHVLGIHSADSSWMYNVNSKEVSAVDSAIVTFLVGHELHMIGFYPESRFGAARAMKDTVFYDSPAVKLSFLDIKGGPVELYYDRSSLVPLGFSMRNHLGRGPEHIDILFESWKTTAGIRAFTEARFLQGSDVYQYWYTDIRFDPQSSDVFEQNTPLIEVR